jgi:membrane protease subunit (stomatin/prohibitin family)
MPIPCEYVILYEEEGDVYFVKDFSKKFPYPVKVFPYKEKADVFVRAEGYKNYSIVKAKLLFKIINH